MNFKAFSYLQRRGYTLDWILNEDVRVVEPGRHEIAGLEFGCAESSLVFTCRTMSGALQGLVLAGWGEQEKRYEWRPGPARWLPICYAQPDDWERLYRDGELILVEGVFDRIAVKRCFPNKAVIARLSKSVAAIQWVLRRYTRLLWVAFDRDEEGEKGARRLGYRLADAVQDDMTIHRLALRGKDPGEDFETYGEDGEAGLRFWLCRQMEEAIG